MTVLCKLINFNIVIKKIMIMKLSQRKHDSCFYLLFTDDII